MTGKLLGVSIILFLVFMALTTGFMLDFIFFYPLFMSFIWIIGGIYFYFHWERKSPGPEKTPTMSSQPFATIIIPCFNEGENVAETVEAASNQNYPDYEIIAVNDGSSDNTGVLLDSLTKDHPRLRVIHFAENQGKAMALRMAAMAAKGEYIVCIDGDGLLHPNATAYLVKSMVDNPRVGAVTGNPRVRTRVTLLGKIQVGEFSSIIGLIKRAQRIYGQIFTVSGVIAAFRRRALHDCGYWDLNMITEDIDISWSMQIRHWQIQYEPNALAWILMPETLAGLWKQRLRWAQGGAEVFFKNITRIWRLRNIRIWMLVLEFCLSTVWALAFALSVVLWAISQFATLPPDLNIPTIWPPAFWGLLLATASLLQFFTALVIESRYDHKLLRIMGWTIWYPIFFWMLSLATTLGGLPKAFFAHRAKRAQWNTLDRGFR
ncbi:MAG TPA: poly-beta-1,6-N-acetyl-D-glucosamine synthase [Alphaproteobacteria bacterium]|nr:poly-beta-1,6-N-acetyl-D-glucosamine synthase [Alphaproteobacteria bacterium]